MAEVSGDLSAFLRAAARLRFELGTFDCSLWLADWIALRCGLDPARDLRGRYRSMDDLRELAGTGRVAVIIARCARAAELTRARGAAAIGDVAVIVLPSGEPTGAIRGACGWHVIATGGGMCRVPAARVRIMAAWKCPKRSAP